MRLTINVPDSFISVDGEGYHELDVTELDNTIHAIQWDGSFGEIEFKKQIIDSKVVTKENELITEIDDEFYLTLFNNAKQVYKNKEEARLAKEKAEEEALLAQIEAQRILDDAKALEETKAYYEAHPEELGRI